MIGTPPLGHPRFSESEDTSVVDEPYLQLLIDLRGRLRAQSDKRFWGTGGRGPDHPSMTVAALRLTRVCRAKRISGAVHSTDNSLISLR